MKAFPMFIKTTGRRVVIVGGGEQAAQKARLMLKTDCDLVLVAEALDDELRDLVDDGRAQHEPCLAAQVFQGAVMVFVGTGCPGFDAAAHDIAKAAGCLVNVVDQPTLCDITTPALVDRDPIVVAIGSEGTSPVLTREIKTRLEQMLPQNLGGLAALAGRLRAGVSQRVARSQRRALWAWVFKSEPRDLWVRGQERDAARAIKSAIAKGGPPKLQTAGSLALVGAGPGARDLMTLRAVERLQEADVIFYDRLVDDGVLELARRDAERVFVGKVVGAHAWSQDRINRLIIAEALKGKHVVRLKSGDPGIFGRANEEADAARQAGVSVEIVPGVTAACAAGAALGRSLTERGVSNTLVLTTGTGRAEDPEPDCTRHAGPGSTTVFYMSVGQAARVSEALIRQGLPSNARVDIAVDVSKPQQRLLHCAVAELDQAIRRNGVEGGAVLMVTWPFECAEVQPLTYSRAPEEDIARGAA
ncbi:MAG: siroheme synthase CysG [Pseudomonadota bacterium]